MKTKVPVRRAWRWIALAAVLASLLAVFLETGRTRQEQVAQPVAAITAPVRANPETMPFLAATPYIASDRHSPVVKDELCGVSGSDVFRAGDETVEQHVARVTEPAISRWKGSLAASEDPRRQAIALALANARPRPSPGDQPSKDTPMNNNLVLLAIETDDPAIYSLALHQCTSEGYGMAPGPCEGLSWEHLVAIDPNNAIPWLWIAARAEHAGDSRGVEDALARASAASGIEEYGAGLAVLAMDALPGDTVPLVEAMAGAQVTSILPGSAPISLESLCSETAIQRSLRKQQCSAITTVLAKQGSTLIDLLLASALADRLGFPQETRTALSAEAKTARATSFRRIPYPWSDPRGNSSFGCNTVRGYDGFIDALRAARGNWRAALGAVGRAMEGAQ